MLDELNLSWFPDLVPYQRHPEAYHYVHQESDDPRLCRPVHGLGLLFYWKWYSSLSVSSSL